MAELNDWQWGIGTVVLFSSLILGGWLSRERVFKSEPREPQDVNETAPSNSATSTDDTSELIELRQLLEERDSELKDAREEAELTTLQLHQVQEELERYYLESRDLQQKLDAVNTEAPKEEKTSIINPEQHGQLRQVDTRMLELIISLLAPANRSSQSPSGDQLEALVQRQRNALRRFQALHKAS